MSAKKAKKTQAAEEAATSQQTPEAEETPKKTDAKAARATILEAFQAKTDEEPTEAAEETTEEAAKEPAKKKKAEKESVKEDAGKEDAVKETAKKSEPSSKKKASKKKAEAEEASADGKETADEKASAAEEAKADEAEEEDAESESEEAPTDNTETARQAILNAFQTQTGAVTGSGVSVPVAAPPQPRKPLNKKTLAMIIAGAVVLIGVLVAVILISQGNARKREQAANQQYAQQVKTQAQDLVGIYADLKSIQSAETTLVAHINTKATNNQKALNNWDTTWQNLVAKYNSTVKSVDDYNTAEQAKSGTVVGTTTDYFGYSYPTYYQPKHKDYPNYPTPPQKIKADFSAELKLAVNLQQKTQVLQSEIASDTIASFPFAQKSINDVLSSVLDTANSAQTMLSDSSFITEVSYSDSNGGSDLDKGQSADMQKVSTLSTQRTNDLMANFLKQFNDALAQYKLTSTDVGLPSGKKQSSGGATKSSTK